MPQPQVSVVIPAHNRTVALRNCLSSLEQQTLARTAFEVVIVDDGSTPPIANEVADFVDGEHTRLFRHERARGAGAVAARGELLVFLDADCLCHPELLSAHLDAQSDGPVAVCGFGDGRELTPASWRLKFGPDWEFTTPLRRELHQFDLTELKSNGQGQSVFRCVPIPWPTTELGELHASITTSTAREVLSP
jgi:glycosyltransferase involved in cell wall biosynthesis